MLTILLCLTHILVPEVFALFATMEVQSAIFALALFGYLVAKLCLRARSRAPQSVHKVNLLSI
jgi:hypothetical protein